MKLAIIASGAGRYSDPWHPFERTSDALAEVVAGAGFRTEVVPDVELAVSRAADADLLVVNAGDPWRNPDAPPAPSAQTSEHLDQLFRRGVGILAMHAAIASLRDYPDWARALGGTWEPGVSSHPPIGELTVRRVGPANPVTQSISRFALTDEGYTALTRAGARKVVLVHDAAGTDHPAFWLRHYGRSRIAYDALGHDERSYESVEHRAIIRAAALWCARRARPSVG